MSTHSLANGRPLVRGRRARAGRPAPRELSLETLLAPARWQRKTRSPELAKALGFIQSLVAEAARLVDVRHEQAPAPFRREATERLRTLLAADVRTLRIDSAWELAGALRNELLSVGDRHYVWTQLEYEAGRDLQRGRWATWSSHFGSDARLVELLELRRRGAVDDAVHAEAIHCLSALYRARVEAGRNRRAKAAQKCLYLQLLTPVLLALLAAVALATTAMSGADTGRRLLLVGAAGALGATLSGIVRLRDKLVELDDLRSFRPAMQIQPLIGATGGLFVLLLLETGAVDLGGRGAADRPTLTLFAFVVGFSEPFFLGLVQKVAVIPDRTSGRG